MKRRTFLKTLSTLPMVVYLPKTLGDTSAASGKTLILVQLGGGNDSLKHLCSLCR